MELDESVEFEESVALGSAPTLTANMPTIEPIAKADRTVLKFRISSQESLLLIRCGESSSCQLYRRRPTRLNCSICPSTCWWSWLEESPVLEEPRLPGPAQPLAHKSCCRLPW